MAVKNRLGRGLSSILEDVEDAYRKDVEEDSSIVKEIDLDKLVPNIHQPRRHFDPTALKELSDSIVKHGLLQPIVVVERDDGYMIIAGERRFRATKLANRTKIEAIVTNYESKNLRELALIENIQRENLTPLELAQSYKELIDEYTITQEELSDIIHKSRSQITNTLRLLSLTSYTQDLLNMGKITQGHAKVLVGLDEKTEVMIADTIVGQKLSVRDSEDLIKSIKSRPDDTTPIPKEHKEIENIKSIVEKLNDLGFNSKKSANKLVINFKNEDEVTKLLNILGA
ncbi:MAG TPA: ParB/RepB/Spo0J family partition protein [Campylobacterales bacterium]|nr:ParB/RepB/Spo0J family partition protein [Campylobacterales bacterium]HIP59680.1 ParB/RepB/Spo0J family partition protein [Campylobacterales bacterium]